MRGQYRDATIQVVCGYVGTEDAWAYHVLVQQPGQPDKNLVEKPSQWFANTQQQAWDKGFGAGIAVVDRPTGFQTQVK
ncbi:MAG: hypothetical protein V4573_17735 [Pseudomonadota bacterium]